MVIWARHDGNLITVAHLNATTRAPLHLRSRRTGRRALQGLVQVNFRFNIISDMGPDLDGLYVRRKFSERKCPEKTAAGESPRRSETLDIMYEALPLHASLETLIGT